MKLSDLLEDGNKDLVIIYPGRFHPFHIGHGKVYQYLKQNYSNAKVFISTSGKVDGDRSPFTFEEKRKMMILAGVDSSAIVQTKSPYQSIEIMERFDKDKTVVVFAVSEKDMAEDPRFDFSNGLKLKKNGEPAYLQKWNSLDDAETFGTRGYIATTPTFKFKVLGQEINSASQIRNMIAKSDDTKLTQMLQDLYSVTDVPQDIIDLFKNKVGNKETMNENWDEHSFSKFLKENVIEDNIMKTGILKTITEGKSPHKKGTKKYNAHMAAMHAESIDEEFDRKVKEVVESKIKEGYGPMTVDRLNSIAADIKDYIDDHKENFDAYPMDVEVDDKVYDWDEYWSILDKVYPDAYDNQYATESESVNEIAPAFLLPWILPALATAVRVGGPALIRLLKVSKNAAGKVINSDKVSNAATSIIKHPGTSLSWIGGGYVFKSVYDVMEKTKEVIGDFLDDLSIEAFAKIVWKHKLPVAAVMAVLYGGKQLKDYMSGEEEEEKGNTTINNYYNKSDDKPVEESYSDDFVYNSDEVKEWITKAENDLGRKITNEEKAELNEFWPAVAAAATRIPPNTYATAATAVGAAASKAGKWIRKKLRNSVDHNLKEDYANEQHEQLEYIHHVLQECGDGNMDITMVEQAIEYVEDIREQHFDDEGNTKSESVNEEDVTVDNAGNIAGYLDTIDEYVLMMFQKADGHAQPGSPKLSQMAYRIQNAVDDIRSRELGLKPSNVRASYANESESVNEHEMSLLGKVARQMEADAHSGDYTAIEELLHNVTEDEMEAFLSDHRSDDFDEGVMGTIGQGIDNAVVGAGKLIKKGAKAAAPHVKKAAKDGVKKISKLGSKNTTTSFDGKGGSSTSVAYNEDDMKDVTPAGYGPDDYDEKDVPPEAHGGDMKKMQDLYRHNEDRNNHSGNIEMLAQAFGNRDEVKAIEGLMKIIKRQGHVTSEQSEMMYNAIHKKYYSQLFPAENEGNAFSGELAKAKIDGKKEFDVDGKTYKVKEALSRLIDKQKMK